MTTFQHSWYKWNKNTSSHSKTLLLSPMHSESSCGKVMLQTTVLPQTPPCVVLWEVTGSSRGALIVLPDSIESQWNCQASKHWCYGERKAVRNHVLEVILQAQKCSSQLKWKTTNEIQIIFYGFHSLENLTKDKRYL